MLGLLVKDIRLLANQKRFFFAVVLLSLVFVFSGQDPMFVVGYATMLCTFFTISTINYDEYNHGFSFLFTLPISRKEYVLEKYVYGLLIGGAAWLITTVLGTVCSYVKDDTFVVAEWLLSAFMILLVLGIFVCLMIPVQFKFGIEKGRTALFIIMIVIMGGATVLMKLDGVAQRINSIAQVVDQMNIAILILTSVLVLVAVTVISIAVSTHIVEKKQF